MVEHLLDDSKIALAKALADVAKRGRRVQRCLLTQLEGFGRFDAHATRAAWEEYERAVETAAAIVSVEVQPAGLFIDRETGEIADEARR